MYYSNRGGSMARHPNMDLILQRHLDDVNDVIGDFNRVIRKKVTEESKQYD